MAKKKTYKTRAKVWLWPAENGVCWHFVTLPKQHGAQIKEDFGKGRRGFGSIRVEATIGKTSWKTSMFPSKDIGSYILPLKAVVRKAEDIEAEDTIIFTVKII